MTLILGIEVRDAVQSVALAGTFVAPGVGVTVDEALIRRQGYTGDLEDLAIKAQVYEFNGTDSWTAIGSPSKLYRVSHGCWSGGVDAPTVAGGASSRSVVVAGLWDDIKEGSIVKVDSDAVTRRCAPLRFVRAAS